MHERQPVRVQNLPLRVHQPADAAVFRIAGHRMADVLQMHADLMRAAGLQGAFEIGVLREALTHMEMRDGAAAVELGDGHALAVAGITADGRINDAVVMVNDAVGNSQIFPMAGLVDQLGGNGLMGLVVLAGDDAAGRVLVDAVDDARPDPAVDAGQSHGSDTAAH
jgi:hypothetical protein